MCLCKEANMCRYTWLPEMGLHVCTQTHMGFGSKHYKLHLTPVSLFSSLVSFPIKLAGQGPSGTCAEAWQECVCE